MIFSRCTNDFQSIDMYFVDWGCGFLYSRFPPDLPKSTLINHSVPYWKMECSPKRLKTELYTLFEMLNMMVMFHRVVIFQIFIRFTQLSSWYERDEILNMKVKINLIFYLYTSNGAFSYIFCWLKWCIW